MNGGATMWIPIIISILISTSGLAFGIIKSSQARSSLDLATELRKQIVEIVSRVTLIEARMYALESYYRIVLERLESVKCSLVEKMDSLKEYYKNREQDRQG